MESLRLRWYKLPLTRPDVKKLGDAMSGAGYTPKRGHGFVLNEVRATHIIGTHVERTEREFVIRDPFGEESRQTFTAYVHTRFRLATEAPGLEVLDPPRSMQLMLSQLAEMADFSLVVSAITLDPLKWIEGIELQGGTALVHRVEFSEIGFGGGTLGALRLDGESDVRAAAAKILGKREYVVRRLGARIRGADDDRTWPAVLERDAKAVIHSDDTDEARAVLRAALVRTIS